MPFISKDWRSPGEEWVKYEGGWEKKSIVTTVDIASTSPKEHLDLIQFSNQNNFKIATTAIGKNY